MTSRVINSDNYLRIRLNCDDDRKTLMNLFQRILFLTLTISTHAVISDPVIRINTTGQPPLNTVTKSGFMDEVAKEAFRRIGYKLQTLRLPAERGLKYANTGRIDGEMSRVKGLNKLYPNLIRVPEKIMNWEFVAFSYKPINCSNGWEDLSGKSVAHINGWKILEKNVPRNAEITKTSNSRGLFNLLKKRRTDIVIYERWGGRHLLRKMMMKRVLLCQPSLATKAMYIYLHKQHKTLLPKLATALATMKSDGSYQKLFYKHLALYK